VHAEEDNNSETRPLGGSTYDGQNWISRLYFRYRSIEFR